MTGWDPDKNTYTREIKGNGKLNNWNITETIIKKIKSFNNASSNNNDILDNITQKLLIIKKHLLFCGILMPL